jgi:DNA primase
MPRIPEAVVEEVRERADIVEVVGSHLKLQKRGSDYWACCPFHKEKSPSFKVSGTRQSFYCFGCRKSGNVFTFVQEIESLDFVEAVRSLARRFGVIIPEPEDDGGSPADREAAQKRRSDREQAYQLLAQMARWYQHRLTLPDAQAARDYLAGRGLDAEPIATFGIGYAPDSWDAALNWAGQLGFARDLMVQTGLVAVRDEDPTRCYDRFRDRLMFPIHDEHGRVVGFSGRVLQADAKTAKYVNSPETDYFHKGRLLYALHLARPHFREHGRALVCEGQLDVIACHRAGLNHAVCSQGTAFTEQHAQLLRRATDTVTLAFDADLAGQKAAVSTVQLLQRAGLHVAVAVLPEGEDPDSLFRHQGPQVLRAVMTAAMGGAQFVYELAAKRHDSGTPQGKADIVQEVLPAIISLDDPVARAAYCAWLAGALQVPENAVSRAMETALRQQAGERGAERGVRSATPAGGAAAPTRGRDALPIFAAPQAREPALITLLDLALHFEPVAQELLEELPTELIPDTPVGKALNLVLAETAAGEWSRSANVLSGRQDLVVCPEVARVLVESGHCGLDPERVPSGQRDAALRLLHQAAADCVGGLRLDVIETRLKEIAARLKPAAPAPVPGPAAADHDQLFREHLALRAQKRDILERRAAALRRGPERPDQGR